MGIGTNDDAGVYRLSEGRALVQTVDFFTPIVDDAFDWGRIGAANALSDVYAMGGQPLTALQLIGWPRDQLSFELAGEVVRGGAAVMAEAGCTIVGGHSVDALEPWYGFAVTGLVDRPITNAGAQVGDLLVLTKPIGTGVITTALKEGNCPPEVLAEAVESMTTLNAAAAGSLMALGVHAVTDVTGFGLLGHLVEMLDASSVGAVLDPGAVPLLPGARELCAAGAYPGGSRRNLTAIRPRLVGDTDEITLQLLADAQTSGGLVAALPPGASTGYPVIGRVVAGGELTLVSG